MNEKISAEGVCLCGEVKIAAKLDNTCSVCHCSMCRRWAGGPLMAIRCDSGIQIQGEDNVGIYDSSDWAERAFCKKCGSNLFYHIKGTDEYHISLGVFGNSIAPPLTLQVFIDDKPDNYEFANKTQNLTGQQIYDMYAPK